MAITQRSAPALPAEIWDMICEFANTPGNSRHPRHGVEIVNWGGQRDLKRLRLVNRAACHSASRLAFRSIGQTQSGVGVRALSQLAGSRYAHSVRALSMDLDNDLALSNAFDSDTVPSTTKLGTMLSQFPRLSTIWVMKYPLAQGPCNKADWTGVRSERAKILAFQWIEAVKGLGPSGLRQLNLVFSSAGQMKQFVGQLVASYPEGESESWFQASMIEEASGPLGKRSAHDVRSILSIMPLDSTKNDRLQIAGSMGRDQQYRSYRLMQYIPARQHLRSINLSNVDLDGTSLERVLLSNAGTLKSIEIFSSTLRTVYWAVVFELITQNCEQVEDVQVGCLGYLLPVSSILEKLSEEEHEHQMALDASSLSLLLQTAATQRWKNGRMPAAASLLCSACKATRRVTQPSAEYQNALKKIEEKKQNDPSYEVNDDALVVTNDGWKNMLWLHRQLWEG